MTWESVPLALVFVVVLAIFLASKIRIARDDERFAVITLGRYHKLLGPGLVIKFSSSAERWHRLRLGELGTWLGDDKAQFGEAVVPVTYGERPDHGVRIERFEDSVVVTPTRVRIVPCEKCGHVNHVSD